MIVWRLSRRRYAADPLSGKGGTLSGGRWHFKGPPVVYASATLSLALLEMLVHTSGDLLPVDLVATSIEIPDDLPLLELDEKRLPVSWRATPPPRALQEHGVCWLERGETAVLEVPSALVPVESNYLVNPRHRDAGRIRIAGRRDFALDPRLLRKRTSSH